ncbi:MAG: hydrogenase [Candidatus Altiarchaeales archaeon IMC4]|nr:MAG: hydrogenase [Candidatus Altiarchaeales archaeon IMC4]
MCLAIPGKILEADGPEGIVDFGGTKRKVRLDLVDAGVGDYVIVHVGYAIEIMDEKEAKETLKYWSEHLL